MWTKEERKRRKMRWKSISLKSMQVNDRAVVSTVKCNDHEMRLLHSHYSVPQIYQALLESHYGYTEM